MGFLTWIVVGLIAGWLAGRVMKGGGYGVLVDIILGILGGGGGRLDLRTFWNLAWWRADWLHHCGICGRGNFGLDYPLAKESLNEIF